MHVLHLASDLGPTSTGRRLSYLVPKLKALGVAQTVGVIGSEYPFGDVVRAAGVMPVRFKIRDAFDLAGHVRYRRFVQSLQPTCIHLWGSEAIRTEWVLRKSLFQRQPIVPYIVTADVQKLRVHPREPIHTSHTWYEPPARLLTKSEARAKLGLTEQARVIVTADRFQTVDAIRNAVWAIDLLKPTSADYVLLILGDGPARPRVQAFASKLGADDNRARFLGIRNDTPDILAAADVVWNAREHGGLHFTFEAIAQGLPVVAFANNPQHDLIVANGSSGVLAKNAFGFAEATHKIMNDDATRKAMSEWASNMMKDWSFCFETHATGLIDEYSRK